MKGSFYPDCNCSGWEKPAGVMSVNVCDRRMVLDAMRRTSHLPATSVEICGLDCVSHRTDNSGMARHEQCTLLLLEPDHFLAAPIRQWLQLEGFKVVEVTRVQDALAYIDMEAPPAAALLNEQVCAQQAANRFLRQLVEHRVGLIWLSMTISAKGEGARSSYDIAGVARALTAALGLPPGHPTARHGKGSESCATGRLK